MHVSAEVFTVGLCVLLAACAATKENPVHADVQCVEPHHSPITIGDRVYLVDNGCSAWTVGPTPKQAEAWAKAEPRLFTGR